MFGVMGRTLASDAKDRSIGDRFPYNHFAISNKFFVFVPAYIEVVTFYEQYHQFRKQSAKNHLVNANCVMKPKSRKMRYSMAVKPDTVAVPKNVNRIYYIIQLALTPSMQRIPLSIESKYVSRLNILCVLLLLGKHSDELWMSSCLEKNDTHFNSSSNNSERRQPVVVQKLGQPTPPLLSDVVLKQNRFVFVCICYVHKNTFS